MMGGSRGVVGGAGDARAVTLRTGPPPKGNLRRNYVAHPFSIIYRVSGVFYYVSVVSSTRGDGFLDAGSQRKALALPRDGGSPSPVYLVVV